MDLLALSRDLIAANTVSQVGTAAAVNILRPLYEQAGLRVMVQDAPGTPEQQNLLGTYPGADSAGLLLVTHLDTVDAGPFELWTETDGNPYHLTQAGDRLFGLGTADTKLDALCKLAAARDFKSRPLRRSLQLLGTFEEEVGAKGARHFVASPSFTARFVACSEPSELTIIRAHKGYAVVRVELEAPTTADVAGPLERVLFEGKSAHSSTPRLGVNAIEKALEQIGKGPFVSLEGGTVANKVPARCEVVRQQGSGSPAGGQVVAGSLSTAGGKDASPLGILARRAFDIWRDLALSLKPEVNPAFEPDRAVVNWGVARIHGGSASLTFDARLLPGHDPAQLTDSFSRAVTALVRSAGGRASIVVERGNPAMELKEPSALLAAAREACRELKLDDVPKAKPTNTEAGVFAAAGAEAIVFGPGRSTGNAHCANEHNLLSQMLKAIEFYRALIGRLCA
ncbi:MAG TPA: M20/M25/M40 family metallo-hydrolase [Myxococcaceae bacterium]|nr:M20/M25/M40 family metallo-hydrolase [Myxococcaceae bacterium]